MKKLLFVTALLIIVSGLKAQDVSSANLTWTVTSLKDLNTGKVSSYSCVFEISGTKNIAWRQKGGAYVRTLSVQAINGSWTDVNVPGKIVFTVSEEGESGTFTAERLASGLRLTLQLSQSAGQQVYHQYDVSKVSLSN